MTRGFHFSFVFAQDLDPSVNEALECEAAVPWFKIANRDSLSPSVPRRAEALHAQVQRQNLWKVP